MSSNREAVTRAIEDWVEENNFQGENDAEIEIPEDLLPVEDEETTAIVEAPIEGTSTRYSKKQQLKAVEQLQGKTKDHLDMVEDEEDEIVIDTTQPTEPSEELPDPRTYGTDQQDIPDDPGDCFVVSMDAGGDVDPDEEPEVTVTIEIFRHHAPVLTFDGAWDGERVRQATAALRRGYRSLQVHYRRNGQR